MTKTKRLAAALAAALISLAPAYGQTVLRSQTISYDNIAALEAVPFARFQAGAAVIIADGGRAGTFIKVTGNESALATADPGKCVFIPSPQDGTGASGGWMREDWRNSKGVVRAEWCGAVADNSTDDSTAINRCLSLTEGECRLQSRGYFTNATKISVGAGKCLVGDNSNNALAANLGTRVRSALATAIVVEVDGGAGSLPACVKNMQITRASGTIPGGSVGLKLVDGNYILLENLDIFHHDVGIQAPNVSGNMLAVMVEHARLYDIDTTAFDINAPQVTIRHSEYGRNGGTGLAVPATVFNIGSLVDTMNIETFTNADPSGDVSRIMFFNGYSNANGIFNITNSHFETFTHLIVTAGGTTNIQRLALIGNTATIPSGTGRILIGDDSPADDFKQLVIIGNRFDGAGWVFDWPELGSATITANYFGGAVSLTGGGNVSFTGNYVEGGITVNGAFVNSSVCGNASSGVSDAGATGSIQICAGLNANTFTDTQQIVVSGLSPFAIQSNENTASAGPNVILFRDSTTPAASDQMAQFIFRGRDSGAAANDYLSFDTVLLDPTAGSEDARYRFNAQVAGALSTLFAAGPGLVVGSATGGDQGFGTINASAIYDDGVLLTSGSVSDGDKGDVVVSASGATWLIDSAASPQVTALNIGHASDTTLARVSAGLLSVEGATIPTLSRANTFTAAQLIETTGLSPFSLTSQEDSANGGPNFTLNRVSASPAANDVLGGFTFNGRDSGANTTAYASFDTGIVDPTNGSEDGQFRFITMVNGGLNAGMTLAQGIQVGAPTGGDKGVGTLNATAVYDDNVLLTDYVFDLAYDGKLHPEDKDDPNAIRFDPRLLDPDYFAEKTREARALPGFVNRRNWTEATRPSTGQLLQDVWEIVEVQAVHIEKLNARIKALEAANDNIEQRLKAIEAR